VKQPPKPKRPSPVARLEDNRAKRAKLPPFPNYTQIPSLLSVRAWWGVRTASAVATVAIAVIAIAAPKTGLKIIWGIGIPLLPILFFLAPGLWRNICPLAASNQIPRVLGFTRALTAPRWWPRYGYLVAIMLFVAFITLRKVGLQTNGPLSGLLLLAALASAFTGGMFLKGKSGWCSSICPLLPVQRIYGQTPFALVPNSHCQPCVGCTKNCYDFNPRVAYLADLDEPAEFSAGRKLFVAAFPGLVLGFFEVPNLPHTSAGHMYALLALYTAVGVLGFFALDSFVPVTSHKITTLYGAAALNIFYWFAFPNIVKAITGNAPPSALTWAVRTALGAVSLLWIARTYAKEQRYREKAVPRAAPMRARGLSIAGGRALSGALGEIGARGLSMAGSVSLAGHRAANADKPEVAFLPDGRRILAEPGRTVLEVAEAGGLSIEAGCRMGVCGADPIAIINGMGNLSPIGEDEASTLERLGLAENTRLACCCRIDGSALVSLEPEPAGRPTASRLLELNYDRSVHKVVVIGNGIAGITAADYVRRNHPECSIDVIADETHHLYNRMAITRLVYGRSAMQGLYLNPDAWAEQRNITLWLNTRAAAVDRGRSEVVLGTGEPLGYDRLILATGSSSFVPPIEGYGAPGTFVMRTADDAIAVRAFAQKHRARAAVVAGGGLLGLEAAFALRKLSLGTTVLELAPRLLPRQLDERASEYLQRCIEGLGLSVRTATGTKSLSANDRLAEVVMTDGNTTPADIFIVAAGIKPNIELAKAAGLETDRGVVVDDHMRTSDERIFAAGDVAQWCGSVSGLWQAAVDQAQVAAEAAVLESTDEYRGTVPVTVLKVSGIELTSIGQIAPSSDADEVLLQEDESALQYGKLVLSRNKLVGAILLGYSTEVAPITTAVKQQWDVTPVLTALRAGRWGEIERVTRGRSLSAVSVVGIGGG